MTIRLEPSGSRSDRPARPQSQRQKSMGVDFPMSEKMLRTLRRGHIHQLYYQKCDFAHAATTSQQWPRQHGRPRLLPDSQLLDPQ